MACAVRNRMRSDVRNGRRGLRLLWSFWKPMAMRMQKPMDGMYKIRSAITKPTFMKPRAGVNGMTRRTSDDRSFLEKIFVFEKDVKNFNFFML